MWVNVWNAQIRNCKLSCGPPVHSAPAPGATAHVSHRLKTGLNWPCGQGHCWEGSGKGVPAMEYILCLNLRLRSSKLPCPPAVPRSSMPSCSPMQPMRALDGLHHWLPSQTGYALHLQKACCASQPWSRCAAPPAAACAAHTSMVAGSLNTGRQQEQGRERRSGSGPAASTIRDRGPGLA